MSKRPFPYATGVPEFVVGRTRPTSNPTREYEEPRVFQAKQPGAFDDYDGLVVRGMGPLKLGVGEGRPPSSGRTPPAST